MAGVQIIPETAELENALRAVNLLGSLGRPTDLLDNIGAVIESSTRRRISEEQRGPDGTPWPEWSDDYEASRHSGHALLMNEGELLDSLAFETDPAGKLVMVGSNLVYAAVHNFGGQELPSDNPASNIPQREFLGLSSEDEADLVDLVNDHIQSLLQ
jgi:phage virion morphogenesis protein